MHANELYLVTIVSPAAKLHVAVLVVEWKPGDVNLASGFEYSGRDVGQQPTVTHHHLDWVGPVKSLVSTAKS